MKKIIVMLTIIMSSNLIAQVGIGTDNPDPTAMLDLESTEKGFLPPRMTTVQRDAINAGSFTEGLTIYNTDDNCLQYWNNTKWVSFCEGNETEGALHYWIDDVDIEDDAKYLYIKNGSSENFSGNLFAYHDIWNFPYSTVPYKIGGITGASWGIEQTLYTLGSYSIPAGDTISLKIELRPQSFAQVEWLPTGSATIPITDELQLSRSIVVLTDEDPVETNLSVTITSYGSSNK